VRYANEHLIVADRVDDAVLAPPSRPVALELEPQRPADAVRVPGCHVEPACSWPGGPTSSRRGECLAGARAGLSPAANSWDGHASSHRPGVARCPAAKAPVQEEARGRAVAGPAAACDGVTPALRRRAGRRGDGSSGEGHGGAGGPPSGRRVIRYGRCPPAAPASGCCCRTSGRASTRLSLTQRRDRGAPRRTGT
jgi:hypothetical protein